MTAIPTPQAPNPTQFYVQVMFCKPFKKSMRCRVRAPSGATAFHIAASRGQIAYVKRLVWSLYHKSGGDSQASYAFGVVRSVLNSPGLIEASVGWQRALGRSRFFGQYSEQQQWP